MLKSLHLPPSQISHLDGANKMDVANLGLGAASGIKTTRGESKDREQKLRRKRAANTEAHLATRIEKKVRDFQPAGRESSALPSLLCIRAHSAGTEKCGVIAIGLVDHV